MRAINIVQYIENLIVDNFTGSIVITFYKGSISHKIERKEFDSIEKEVTYGETQRQETR